MRRGLHPTSAAAVWVLAGVLLATRDARAGQPPAAQAPSLRLDAAVDLALSNYPAIRAAEGQTVSARGAVDLARTAYLPRTDLVWQQNRATRNNVAGLLLPQSVIPSISGFVSTATSLGSSWGSAGGLLMSWEAFDFGLRRANVAVAQHLVQEAAAGFDVTRLQVAVTAAAAFLGAVAAEQTVRAAQANIDRLEVFLTSVAALVQNQLRPGADESRANAELAAARIQLFQSRRSAAVARAALAEAIGVAGESVTLDPGTLLQAIPPPVERPATVETHPLAQAQQASVDAVRGREQALDRAYAPRVNVQGAWFGRGAAAPGAAGSGSQGLFPDTTNWAAGLSLSFPVFDLFSVRARRQVEAGNEATERARYEQTLQALRADDARARADLEAARLIASVSPIELKAAQDAESQARARYQAGLANITEIADAQRLLAQGEIDDRLARLDVWRALLAEAGAHGDLTTFLEQVRTFGAQP